MRHYRWKAGTRFSVDPQTAGETIEQLREQNGGILTADDVVMAAADPEHPLHRAFEWDNDLAAHNYRKATARRLLRSLVCSVTIEKQPRRDMQAFVNVQSPAERGYTSIVDAMGDAQMRMYVLAEARRELRRVRDKYEHLSELASLWEAIEKELSAA